MEFDAKRLAATVVAAAAVVVITLGAARAATITVNSLADDVFVDNAGATRDINGNLIVLGAPKCTLRMAMAAANRDQPIGGGNGCASGALGSDMIVFDLALNLTPATPGTIVLANKSMDPTPAVFVVPVTIPPLFAATPMTIVGPGSSSLTIDGSFAAAGFLRILGVTDGLPSVLFQFMMSGVRLVRGATSDNIGGCMISSESISLSDVVFENCESVSGANIGAVGGALFVGVDASAPGAQRPNVTLNNSRFNGNRASRGASPYRSEAGAVGLGGTHATSEAAATDYQVGAVSITNTVFNGNTADTRGALQIAAATSVTITASHFAGNASTGSNAAGTSGRQGGFLIANIAGTVTINGGTRIVGNVANESRAGFGIQAVTGAITIDQVDISGNTTNLGPVGGFEIVAGLDPNTGLCGNGPVGTITISTTRLHQNSAAANVGGATITCSGPVQMTDTSFVGNESRGFRLSPADTVSSGSAALDLDGLPSVALTRVLIERNNAPTGGFGPLVAKDLGSFTADTMRVVNNLSGGGPSVYLNAFAAGRNYLILNSEISGNSTQNVGAIFIEGDGNYTLRNSTVSANTARVGGGSIVKANANTNTAGGINIAIEHSTIARNFAAFEDAFAVAKFANMPNSGVMAPTLFAPANATISIVNSILATRSPGFTGASSVAFDATAGPVSASYSLLENSSGEPAGFCLGTGMKCDIGSLVSPLADNGGVGGIRTMALMAGSPAINAGGPVVLGGLIYDERGTGFPRVNGGTVDMGAFESDAATTYGCTLDADGNGVKDGLTDAIVIIRALLGFTGTNATNGAIAVSPAPTRGNWTAIRNYFNANCGTNFLP